MNWPFLRHRLAAWPVVRTGRTPGDHRGRQQLLALHRQGCLVHALPIYHTHGLFVGEQRDAVLTGFHDLPAEVRS